MSHILNVQTAGETPDTFSDLFFALFFRQTIGAHSFAFYQFGPVSEREEVRIICFDIFFWFFRFFLQDTIEQEDQFFVACRLPL